MYPEGKIFGSCVQCRRRGRTFLNFVFYMYPGFCILHVSCILCSVSCIRDFSFYMNPADFVSWILYSARFRYPVFCLMYPGFCVLHVSCRFCILHLSRILYSTYIPEFVSCVLFRVSGICILHVFRILYSTFISDFVFYMYPGFCNIHVPRILYSTCMYPGFCNIHISRIL